MLSIYDLGNILLPVISHWMLWLSFLIFVVGILFLYSYPYVRKPKKEFRRRHVSVPVAGVISLYIFTKMLEGVIYQGAILKFDNWFNNFTYSSGMTKLALVITNFGSIVTITFFFILAAIILILKKRWRYALLSTIAILGGLLLQISIKTLVHRVRPENMIENSFSFPSGHSITAIVFVSLLIYSFKDDFKNRNVRYVLISTASVFFISVGISRIILHVHWFSDVIAGMSLGLSWFMLLVLIERAIPGVAQAVKVETKEAKPIVPVEAVKVVKEIVKTA